MANIKSNIKSVRKTIKRKKRNSAVKSTYKTLVKKSKINQDKNSLNAVYKKIDSACAKGIITKNKANRIKSRTAKYLNKNKK